MSQHTDPPTDNWGQVASDYARSAGEAHLVYAAEGIRLSDLPSVIAAAAAADGRPVRVLDIASGPGPVAIQIARALVASGAPPGSSVLATDYSPGMVEICESKVAEAGLGSIIQSKVMDGQDLSQIETGTVDIIYCQFGIMFFPDLNKGIAEMRRVLRPNTGFAVITTWQEMGTISFLLPTLERVAKKFNSMPDPLAKLDDLPFGNPLQYNTTQSLVDVFTAGGFRGPNIVHRTEDIRDTPIDHMLHIHESKNPIISSIFRMYGVVEDSPDIVAALQDETTKEFLGRFPDGVGKISWTALQLVAKV